ncbi:hypothetical protein [Cuniculiplasma divulgatum]|jgi:uncharacterized membrane protein|uniref:Membrane protein n=1 Tax=Cuniculiplasma divulgatum TaxID=1673428 RepID=A0A1N5VB46_9ARCH|nr:hypothetical protein [Cuniculiplasma divulgatum]EQB69618.1 MAG: hypothetical protein AMDU5_GPLC00003G0168 [Thermoplasmatales archaeon Gpl]MCI2412959.1 hypothetical protein [Cuniculiplasma sp.]WMT49424.1 MAG: hypothetical protein RE472_00300 [Thermoplasmatales archaeon]SIM69930.1 membrane protein [Cuniculiplasma divulgatum]
MDMGKVFLFALLGAVIGAVLGIVASLLVTQNNFRVMFLMTFTEVGVIVGLLGGAKIEDRKSIN